MRTTALWREHALLGFFDRSASALAGACPRLRARRSRARLGARGARARARPADANDYGTPRLADFAPLARDAVEIAVLSQADIDGVARIDRRHTGRDRRGYLCRTVAEALADSALRVSLAARIDHALAGYVMARLDYGDFGRAEPVAVIDMIGVDPLRAHQGVGRAAVAALRKPRGAWSRARGDRGRAR